MLKNPTLVVLGLVMFINSLAYATIIPLLYPYATRFGINPLGLSLLFASFSIAQFLATPVLGRLSDKYGRKPVLLFCLFGTSLALALFAAASSVILLFVSRIIDGITGGNISVAQAIIADTTSGEERARSFGVIGAAFGLGFLLGPALGGLLGQYGLSTPFWFASALALAGTLIGAVVLKETLPPADQRKVNKEPLINFKAIGTALMSPTTGLVLLISFIAALAINTFIIGFQTYTNDVMKLGPAQIGLLFTSFGFVQVIMQVFGLKILLQKFSSKKKIISISLAVSAVILLAVAGASQLLVFAGVLIAFAIFSAPLNPIIAGLLSERTNPEDQGGILGINQSYVSLGQIIGPIAAGLVAASISIPAVFVLAAGLYGLGAIVSYWLYRPVKATANI